MIKTKNIYNKNFLYLYFQYYHKKENYYYRDFYENDEYIKKFFEEKNLKEQIYNYLRLIRMNSLENIILKNFFYLVLNKKSKNITIFDEFLVIKTLFFSISYIKINCDFPIKKIYSTLKINCQPKNLSDTILKLTSELILYVDNFKDFLFDNE